MARARKPIFLVVDTCVWLDLAKDYSQRPLLGALEEMVRMGFVNLIAPQIVMEEFARNRERIIEESGRSIAGALRRAKEMVAKFGDAKHKDQAIQQLNEVDQKSVNYRDAAEEAVQRIEKLLHDAEVVKTTDKVKLRGAERALAAMRW
jgi:hypothetical protein